MSPARKHPPFGFISLAGVAGVLLLSCMATPPSSTRTFAGGRVRAASQLEAAHVEDLVSRLRPELLGLLPDSSFTDLEIWVQERPGLYRFNSEGTAEAEGLWSPTHRRIMLSRHADHLERTLVHELTHAALGETWQMLPGSLEEGLADHVSASLCEDGAARLRAGRLSSACLATGGLALDIDIVPGPRRTRRSAAIGRTWSTRIRLKGDTDETDPLDVFRLAAGLSSTRLDIGAKRGFYGLAYLVVSRIAENGGYQRLHALCEEAARRGEGEVAVEDVLSAARLTADPAEWGRAAAQAMGRDEIVELVRMYPDFLVQAVDGYLRAGASSQAPREALEDLEVSIRLAQGNARVSLHDLPFVRDAILAARPAPRDSILVSAR
ncbi:MAG: hypothetical protein VX460_11960 [Planctomycetota bacterium]|nr:hypothetical protein [Planctomycetota bacterium]